MNDRDLMSDLADEPAPEPSARTARSAPPTGRAVRTFTAAALLAAIGLAAFVGYWAATGGRWFVIETPSMGTAAPVGTLVWVKPVPAAQLHVGELITFRPPGSPTTYTHRVYQILGDGTIRTKGQITPPDPWRLAAKDVVGKVEMRWWGIGWLVKALPVLLIGGLLVWLLAMRLVPRRWRQSTALLGSAVVAAIAVVIYQPLTRAVQLTASSIDSGGKASYVSTGLLPLRLSAPGSAPVDIRAGQVGTVISNQANAQGRYPASLHPHIPLAFWIALVVACFLPALWDLVVGVHRDRPAQQRAVAVPAS